MKQEVFVVYRGHGPWEGVGIHAICSSQKAAEMAKNKLTKYKVGKSRLFKDADLPMSHPEACPFKIEKVSVDMIYPFSIMQDEKEAIS